MAQFNLDVDEFDSLQASMESYGEGALKEINDVLNNEAPKEIEEEIMKILPASGRTWKRKRPPARNAQPFTSQSGTLSVTVKTVSSYNYLYFPDDGSNTVRHAGNQQFMAAGAEEASEKIVEMCIGRLTENL